MKLLIKIPTRERGFDWLADYVENITNPNTQIWLTLDYDDISPKQAKELQERYPTIKFILGISTSKIHAVNRDIEAIRETFDFDIVLIGSDDMQPIVKGFDNTIIKYFEQQKTTDFFLWIYDGFQNRICTIPCMGIDYYNRFGYIYHPQYKSFFCDNLQTDIALKLGKCGKLSDALLLHQHPAFGNKVAEDDLYRRNAINWNHDKMLYNQHRRNLKQFIK